MGATEKTTIERNRRRETNAFSQEERRAIGKNDGDSKRAAESESDKRPRRRAADPEDRMVVSRSVKRYISRERRSKDRDIVQERRRKQRESIEGR